jgi:hypothetical protein
MDYQAELRRAAKRAIAARPEHRCAILDLYTLAVDAIEDGASAAHEYGLFIGSLNELKPGRSKGALSTEPRRQEHETDR